MADVWSYNIQWLVGEDTGKSLNTHSFFLPTRNLYLCIAQKNGTVAESTKRPPDFSQRNNTSDSSRLLSVNLPALQISISLPLICSSALSCWFLQWQAGTSCTHKPEICLPEASSYEAEVNSQHLVEVAIIGAFDLVTTQDGHCGSVIYVQTIHNTN